MQFDIRLENRNQNTITVVDNERQQERRSPMKVPDWEQRQFVPFDNTQTNIDNIVSKDYH